MQCHMQVLCPPGWSREQPTDARALRLAARLGGSTHTAGFEIDAMVDGSEKDKVAKQAAAAAARTASA